jgi:hypothetical protein
MFLIEKKTFAIYKLRKVDSNKRLVLSIIAKQSVGFSHSLHNSYNNDELCARARARAKFGARFLKALEHLPSTES